MPIHSDTWKSVCIHIITAKKRFLSHAVLRQHMNIHSRVHGGDKPYKCHMCDNVFGELDSQCSTNVKVHEVKVKIMT